eukprot:jgi/Ulvmu1/6665/UM003_0303.1
MHPLHLTCRGSKHAHTRSSGAGDLRSQLTDTASRRVRRASLGPDNYIGIDFGTSGARLSVIDDDGAQLATARAKYGEGPCLAETWEAALADLLQQLPGDLKQQTKRLAFDGTSATAMLLDRHTGAVLEPPKLYNEVQPQASVEATAALVPEGHASAAATSSLCKLLTWHLCGHLQQHAAAGAAPQLLHQADWLASLLTGERTTTDWNNALKLGFDVHALAFLPGLSTCPFSSTLPSSVLQPGATLGRVSSGAADVTGLPEACEVAAGTTDSIAAFLAAGLAGVGHAVTSLGSTMAIKLLSERAVDDGRYGVYSHRLGMGWLVGGASNTGGAALAQLFSAAELALLSPRIDPAVESPLRYYPLPRPGERFPVSDANLPPCTEPRPADDAEFLHGLLESIARIEADAYSRLQELGASPVQTVLTAGGGAVNDTWTQIRQRRLGVPVKPSPRGEASYGAALLAKNGGS